MTRPSWHWACSCVHKAVQMIGPGDSLDAESCRRRSLASYGCTLSTELSARRVYGPAHARACCPGGTRYAYL
jgi:hypothetical protein